MKKQHIQLSEVERDYLIQLLSKGQHPAKLYKRAQALLELDRGQTYSGVAALVKVTLSTVSGWARKYRESGLECLADQARSGRPVELDGTVRAKITALACSVPPEGYGQWSLRLLAEKAVELDYCEHVSHNAVREILKKTNSSLT